MGSTRGTPPATRARRHDALAARMRRLVEEVCNGGNLAALDAALHLSAPPTRPPRPGRWGRRCGITWQRRRSPLAISL
jgi:hypothetical protein